MPVKVWAELGTGDSKGSYAKHPTDFDCAADVDPVALFTAHPEYAELFVRDEHGSLLASFRRWEFAHVLAADQGPTAAGE